jgi:hypothetical protein
MTLTRQQRKRVNYEFARPSVVKEHQGIDGFLVGIKASDKLLCLDVDVVRCQLSELKRRTLAKSQEHFGEHESSSHSPASSRANWVSIAFECHTGLMPYVRVESVNSLQLRTCET